MATTVRRLAAIVIVSLFLPPACANEDSFERQAAGVIVTLIGICDEAGHTWNPAGQPIQEAFRSWAPERRKTVRYFDFESRKEVAGKQVFFLFKVSAKKQPAVLQDAKLTYSPALRSRNVTISRGNFEEGYPSLEEGCRLDQVDIVTPADQTELGLEVIISAGPWDRVADTNARRSSTSVTSISDGGRSGVALMTSVGYEREHQGLTAVASLSLRDHEDVEESYRLVALDETNNVLVATTRNTNGGFVQQLVLACPPNMPMPTKFQLQQRPRIPVSFEPIQLTDND